MRVFHSIIFMLFLFSPSAFSQSSRHVILIIIDGARYSETLGDSTAQYTPRMHEIGHQGVVVDTFLNDSITVTKRAIPAIWSGSWAVPKDTTVNGYANQYATAPTVWEYFRKARGADSTQAMYIMKNLNSPWIQSFHPDYGQKYWPWYILEGSSDLSVWQNAYTKLRTYHPALTVLYFPDVDSYGSKDWTSYTNAIRTADSIVGMLWDFVQNDVGFQNKTTLLVTNDHGRHLDGVANGFLSHGDGCWGCRHIMFLGVGDGLPKGIRTSKRHVIPDIVPTIGSLLQFTTPYVTGVSMTDILTTAEQVPSRKILPTTMALEQNYPNPFNPATTISFSVNKESYVTLTIYDLLGREVAALVDDTHAPGFYRYRWDAGSMSSGMYFYRMTATPLDGGKKDLFSGVKRLLLLK
jgi:hypothetical protein